MSNFIANIRTLPVGVLLHVHWPLNPTHFPGKINNWCLSNYKFTVGSKKSVYCGKNSKSFIYFKFLRSFYTFYVKGQSRAALNICHWSVLCHNGLTVILFKSSMHFRHILHRTEHIWCTFIRIQVKRLGP